MNIGKKIFLSMLLLVFALSCQVAIAQEDVVLKIWDTAAPLRDPFREIIFEKFESENPGVKVEYEGIPWAQYMEKIVTSIAAGTAPDVIRFGYVPRFARRYCVPLDDYIHGPEWRKFRRIH